MKTIEHMLYAKHDVSPYEGSLQSVLTRAGTPCSSLPADTLLSVLFANEDANCTPEARGNSILNNNGTPMQLALSSGSHPVRVLADVASTIGQPSRRLSLSISTARALAQRMNFETQLPELQTLLDTTLPAQKEAVEKLTSGAIWVAVGYSADGADRLSVYANGGWGREPYQAWLRPIRLLARLAGEGPVAWLRSHLPLFINRVKPAGSALDFGPQGLRAIKLYFRTTGTECEAIGAELAGSLSLAVDHGIQLLSANFFEDQPLPSGTFLTLLFRPGDIAPAGVKLDVCAHCTRMDEGQIADRWNRLAAKLDVESGFYRSAIDELDIKSERSRFRHANLGIGYGGRHVRLNTYLQPIASFLSGSAGRGPAERMLWSGVEYLLQHQDRDGKWSDFLLPVGPSISWVTAVAGRALVATRSVARERSIEEAISAAADWLSANERDGGGWGYNAEVPVDADTTAHAAVFLHAATGKANQSLAEVLLRFRCADGGYGTFVPGTANGGWVKSQPDVTAVVGLALARLLGKNAQSVRSSLRYCWNWSQASRAIPSYWWKSQVYAPAMMALLFSETEAPDFAMTAVDTSTVETSLDQALALILLACSGEDQSHVLDALIARQGCDGSWPASTQLCVTDPDCLKPWAVTDGYARCFTDHNRIFTTSITVCALALALSSAKPVCELSSNRAAGTLQDC